MGLPSRLPWHPHQPLPDVPTAAALRLAFVVNSPRLRAALVEELRLRAGSDREPFLPSCEPCAELLAS